MKASDILTAGAGHLKDREATYDQPGGERSIPNVVAAFNALTGHALTAEQGWLFQVLLKVGRSQQGGYKADNYEDGAAYFALMGEQAAGDRKTPECPVNDQGKVLLPVGYTPYRKNDPLPGPGSIVSTVDKDGHVTENRKLGYFRWAGVVGYRLQAVNALDLYDQQEAIREFAATPPIPAWATHRLLDLKGDWRFVRQLQEHQFIIDDDPMGALFEKGCYQSVEPVEGYRAYCAQHLCKNRALPGHVVCADHKIP